MRARLLAAAVLCLPPTAALADPPPSSAPPYRTGVSLQPVAIYDAAGNVALSFGGPDNWTPAGFPLTVTATGPQASFVVPDGASSAVFELQGTAVINIEASLDATTDTDGTWTAVFGKSEANTGTNPPAASISSTSAAFRRRLFPLTAGRRYRLNVGSFSAGAVVQARLRSAPYSEQAVHVINTPNVNGTLASAGTNRSTTVGTTAVTLMASNTARRGWKVKNDSAGDLWINFDTTATATAGAGNIKVPAGGYLASEPGFVETGAMSAIGSAAALAITAREH